MTTAVTPPIEVTADLTRNDQIDWFSSNLWRNTRLWLIVSIVLAVVAWVLDGMSHGFSFYQLFAFVILLVMFVPLMALLGQFALMLVSFSRLTETQRQCAFTFDEGGALIQDADGNLIGFKWDQVPDVRLKPTGLSILTAHMGARWVPSRAFSDDELAAMRALLVRQNLLSV